ncbi:MAG: DMT family transporter [Sphingobium sp.]
MTSASLPPEAAGPPGERPLYAMFLRLSAGVVLSLMWALGKLVGSRGVNLVEILFYRQLFALPLVYGWVVWTIGARGVATGKISLHATRAAIGLIGMAANFGAVLLLPLAEATTISFTAPLFATIFSAFFLREATGIHRWSAVLCGFLGVLIMARPDAGHFPLTGFLVAITGAIGIAVISILLRTMSRTESPSAIVFWFTLLCIPPLGLLMIRFAQPHDPVTWVLICALGISGGVAQLLLTNALRWARVAIVLPMDYSAIIWSALLGWLVWSVAPLVSTWIGAAVIVLSGLYIVLREHRLGRIATLRAQADADMHA